MPPNTAPPNALDAQAQGILEQRRVGGDQPLAARGAAQEHRPAGANGPPKTCPPPQRGVSLRERDRVPGVPVQAPPPPPVPGRGPKIKKSG